MTQSMWTPFFTAYDPGPKSDGSIDPLGLQADASRLADLLLPGFTVRMERLRTLTVSAFVLEASRQIAGDSENVLPYRLALERTIAAALAKGVDRTTDPPIRGYPGRLKAVSAKAHGDPLTPERYIRGPATNGVVGVYAKLARAGGLVNDDLKLEPRGYSLLDVWERDCKQSLRDAGPGAAKSSVRKALERTVARDVEEGRVDPKPDVEDAIFRGLRLDKGGTTERKTLEAALMDPATGVQPRVLKLLRRSLQREADAKRAGDDDLAEAAWRGETEYRIVANWQKLQGSAQDAIVATVARAIVAYERVAEHVLAPFEAFRWLARTSQEPFLQLAAIDEDRRTGRIARTSMEELPEAFERLQQAVDAVLALPEKPCSWGRTPGAIRASIDSLAAFASSRASGADLLQALVVRHLEVQRIKRKGSWLLEQGHAFRFIAGPPITSEKPRQASGRSFIHAFRLTNAISILEDLGG